jgi:stage II sporulation protein P
LLLSAASLYCLVIVCGFSLAPEVYANSPSQIITANQFYNSSSAEKITSSTPLSSATPSPKSESSEIPATVKNTAKGKIINRTIDSSGANLKYQKIYVKNQTGVNINLKTELLTLPKLKIATTEAPQVLIVHTHTTECYMNDERGYYTDSDITRTTDQTKNVVAVGNILKETLNKKGIITVQATEKHDYPEYTGSYQRAEQTIKKYLEKYPTIKVVVDLHRDSVTDSGGTKSALVTNIKGKKAAQVMLVSGCESGNVTGFKNWRENFRLAIKLQQTMEVLYPTLARPILFTSRKYNQHLTTGSLLIECGTEANTLDQAKYSAEILGESLAATLNTLK